MFDPYLKNLHLPSTTFVIQTNFQSQRAFKASGAPCSQPSGETHHNNNALLPKTQSAYRPHHSMETAVLRVVSDIRVALDVGHVSLLLLLDMSAAFNAVDHDILIARLDKRFAVRQTPLQWFRTYLSVRNQTILASSSCNVKQRAMLIQSSVLQGSGTNSLLPVFRH